MNNNLHHFKFTKKENILNLSKSGKKETDSIKKERKYSKIFLKILNSNKSYNNKVDFSKNENIKIKNIKQIISLDKSEMIFKNNLKKSKIDIKDDKKIIERAITERNIKNKKIKELKEIIKHKLNLKIEQKFSFLKFGNNFSKINTTDSHLYKNKEKKECKKIPLKNILKYKNNKTYILANKKASNNASKISIFKKKDKINKTLINKSLGINNLKNFNKNKNILNNSDKIRKKFIKKLNTESPNQKFIKILDYSSRKESNNNNKNNILLNKSQSIKIKSDKNFLQNSYSFKPKNKSHKEILYIKLGKDNISLTENKAENLSKNYNLFNSKINGIKPVKKKLLILLDDFYSNKNNTERNNITISSQPEKLIDKIRTLKKLNKIRNFI